MACFNIHSACSIALSSAAYTVEISSVPMWLCSVSPAWSNTTTDNSSFVCLGVP
jgi:hypothetical protein